MRRTAKILLALLAAALLLLGALFTVSAETARTVIPGAEGLRQRTEENALRLEARSKKNKNKNKNRTTAAPAKSETAAPAPEKGAGPEQPTATPVPDGPIIDPQSIADYLFAHDMQLPDNFITKAEARRLGWDSRYNSVSDVAPGKSIGGDYFGNYEEKLPTGQGIRYREADCWYTGGSSRGKSRVVFSTEGRVWYTKDHYETFTELFSTVP